MKRVVVSNAGEMAAKILDLAGEDAEIQWGSFVVTFHAKTKAERGEVRPVYEWDKSLGRAVQLPRKRRASFGYERTESAWEMSNLPRRFWPKS